ncbi:MAG: porin [Polyangiales bacterium]
MLAPSKLCLRSILVSMVLASASTALAQKPDAGSEPEQDAGTTPEQEAEDKHPRLVKPEGDQEDNAQLGGEPSLTEVQQDEKEQHKKRTLQVGKETGSIGKDLHDDPGDTLAAEPSTTSLSESKAKAPDEGKLPGRLGPVRIRVGKTDDWVGIGFGTQLQFEYDQQFAGAGAQKSSTQKLEFRRIRTTLSSSFIEGRIQTRFQLNLTPSAAELIDMWFGFTRFKFASLRVGQFKIPYDRYRAQSFAALSTVDWAPTVRMFGSERQIGLEMHAGAGVFKGEYAIGLFSGVNARSSHAVGITELYGETPQNPSALGSGSVVSEFHPEITARAAKNFGNINTDTNSDVLGTKELRQSLGAGFSWDARPVATKDLGLRLSLEWLAKISHAHINIVSYLAWYKPWQGGKILFGPIGFLAEVGYRFTTMWELALQYGTTYLTPWLRSDARSYGQSQIDNATDQASAMAQYGQNGNQITSDQLALAGTSHIIGNSLKVVAEAAWESQLWDLGRQNGLRLTLQLQFLF